MGLFIIAANLSNISSKRALWILLLAIQETKNNNQMTRQNKRNTHPKIVFSDSSAVIFGRYKCGRHLFPLLWLLLFPSTFLEMLSFHSSIHSLVLSIIYLASIGDLQYCISFSCKSWFNIFIDYTPFKVTTKQWLQFPVLYSISFVCIYFIHNSLYLLIPYPYLSPLPVSLPTSNH